MITDIPTPEEFQQAGADYLNLAWENLVGLGFDLIEAQDYADELRSEDEPESKFDEDAYWKAAQRTLSTSVTLLHQGVELFLKGLIAKESPYILLSSPQTWPGNCQSEDKPFSDFRTIDAQDLVKVANTVSKTRLDENFVTQFKQLRRRRNEIMHSVGLQITFQLPSLMEKVLDMSAALIGKNQWIPTRRKYVQNSPLGQGFKPIDDEEFGLFREGDLIRRILEPGCLKTHFDVDKSAGFYMCPECFLHSESRNQYAEAFTAQLQQNTAEATILHCFLCGQDSNVLRKKCSTSFCESDVFGGEDSECLLCGSSADED